MGAVLFAAVWLVQAAVGQSPTGQKTTGQAGSGQAQAGPSFSIARSPKVGDSIKYTMSAQFSTAGASGTIAATLLEQVTKIDKDGSYSVQQTQIDATATYDKEDVPVPARTPITLTYRPDRKVASMEGSLIDGNSFRVENLATVVDPGKPVSIGDVWSAEIKAETKADKTPLTPAVVLDYKLLGLETVAGVETLKIQASGKEVGGVAPATHIFTIWLSKADGSMIQLDSKWENAPFTGISEPVTASIKMVKASS